MTTITIKVNDLSAVNFNDFSEEMKQKISNEVGDLIAKMNYDARVSKLQKLVEEINACDHGMTLNPDIILELLRIEGGDEYELS